MLCDDALSASCEGRELGLNAPFGARCFVTDRGPEGYVRWRLPVLMHLLALGAL